MKINLSEKNLEILDLLLVSEKPMDVNALVDRMGITKTAIKNYLSQLLDYGLIDAIDDSGSIGRPRKYYKVSEKGKSTFVKKYSWIAVEILNLLAVQFNTTQMNRFMENLAQQIYQNEKSRFNISDLNHLMNNLLNFMNELGYKAQLLNLDHKQDHYIEARNCIYHEIALKHPAICEFDIKIISLITQKEVVLQKCMAKGQSSCVFCIKNN